MFRSLGNELNKLIHPIILEVIASDENGELRNIAFIDMEWTPFLEEGTGPASTIETAMEVASIVPYMYLENNNLVQAIHLHLTSSLGQEPISSVDIIASLLCVFSRIDEYLPMLFKISLRQFQDELTTLLKDPDSRIHVLNDITDFYTAILLYILRVENDLYKDISMQLAPYAPHLTKNYKRALVVINTHPHTKQCTLQLQQTAFPRPFLFTKGFTTRQFSPDQFAEIIRKLPPIINMCDFIKEWDREIWRTDITTVNVTSVSIDYTPTPLQSLIQIIIFMLPNWQQLWVESNFPCSYETIKRLNRMKEREWVPPPSKFVQQLLTWASP